MQDMPAVRVEAPDDIESIRRVTVNAFSQSSLGYHGEAELIDELRSTCESMLSLVACRNHELIGHVLFTPVTLVSSENAIEGMGLAPLSVDPACQKTGVGKRLIEFGLGILRAGGCRFVVVLGHPSYYRQHGFEPAENCGLTHGFDGIPQTLFAVHRPDLAIPIPRGRVYYQPPFGLQHTET